jgi:hypothetical protein
VTFSGCGTIHDLQRLRGDGFSEHALAHVVGDETERAYRRRDALMKRRELMGAWTAR